MYFFIENIMRGDFFRGGFRGIQEGAKTTQALVDLALILHS